MKQNENCEYPFTPVPRESRKEWYRLAIVMSGFAFSSAGLTLGADLGQQMTFKQATGACFTGNLFLFFIAAFWGILSCKTGSTGVFIIEKYLGEKTAALCAGLMIFFLVLWIGINGDAIARMFIVVFPRMTIPFAAAVLLAIFSIMLTSVWGWRGMEILNWCAVPIILVMAFYHMIKLGKKPEMLQMFHSFAPDGSISFFRAVIRVIGNFSLSAVMVADVCRFAKNKKSVYFCTALYSSILFFCNMGGIMLIQITGANNVEYGLYSLKIAAIGFVWVILCVYTTQNLNVYVGGLALQKLLRKTILGGNISYKTSVYFIGALALIAGIIGMDKYVGVMTEILTLLIVVLTAAVHRKQRKKGHKHIK